MSENTRASGSVRPRAQLRGNPFQRLVMFFSQIMAELRKVVTPTREELLNYTLVVVVFVLLMMLFVFGLDQLFMRLVAWAFGNG